jgi:hypothetical protein
MESRESLDFLCWSRQFPIDKTRVLHDIGKFPSLTTNRELSLGIQYTSSSEEIRGLCRNNEFPPKSSELHGIAVVVDCVVDFVLELPKSN